MNGLHFAYLEALPAVRTDALLAFVCCLSHSRTEGTDGKAALVARQQVGVDPNRWSNDRFGSIGNGIHVSYYQELLLILHQLRYRLAEERERRVGHHDVRLLEQFDALGAAEVAVAPQGADADLFGIGHTVGVAVAQVFQPNGLLVVVAAEEVGVLVLVASGDEAFQAQLLEAVGKVAEEVAGARVVAVAEDGLPSEVFTVMTEFVLDVGQLSVEFVFLSLVGGL